jgi:putative redox protein
VRLSQKRVHGKDCQECEEDQDAFVHRIERSVTFKGALSAEQIARLQEIARKCPIHKTLTSPIVITELDDEDIAE